ncbi:MAG: bifunctional 4-hydroxy-2-oxoglutarate aldolase/2-dehydro-3-deoxy-phosphogluconate aldolase [Burkholderiales bacterium]|nr:bifunctional 4-hydroxy-2-oxoglutarate aldolase/2-dehydro-3-deoxy-phosphogluconate aldolase [Burkholderiales bacterium]
MSAADIAGRLIAQRVVPVLRLPSAEEAGQAVDALAEAGFRVFEITLTVPGALALIEALRHRFGAAATIGAGTVLDLASARRCVDAGAEFLVSPCRVDGLAELAHACGRAALAGGFTPTEVLAAHRSGADIVKVFPAASGGPAHLAALHSVFPDIVLCPTGGISADNLTDYFAAGARLVGVGNDIVDRDALRVAHRARVVAHARRFLDW